MAKGTEYKFEVTYEKAEGGDLVGAETFETTVTMGCGLLTNSALEEVAKSLASGLRLPTVRLISADGFQKPRTLYDWAAVEPGEYFLISSPPRKREVVHYVPDMQGDVTADESGWEER